MLSCDGAAHSRSKGYLSEAGASLVDMTLGLGVVPKTRVVNLVSDAFYYSKFDRARARAIHKAVERFPDSVRRQDHVGS